MKLFKMRLAAGKHHTEQTIKCNYYSYRKSLSSQYLEFIYWSTNHNEMRREHIFDYICNDVILLYTLASFMINVYVSGFNNKWNLIKCLSKCKLGCWQRPLKQMSLVCFISIFVWNKALLLKGCKTNEA